MTSPINYIQIANQIHSLDRYNQLYEAMQDCAVLQQIFFHQSQKQQNLIFAACQIFSKKLINRQFTINNLTIKTINQIEGKVEVQSRKLLLLRISKKLYFYILYNQKSIQKFMIRSCLNTISLCLQTSIASTHNFNQIIIQFFQIMAPGFQIDKDFIKNNHLLSFIRTSKQNLNPNHYILITIFSFLLEYTINSAYHRSYYQFRRNLYHFKNIYYPYLLNYGIFCLKTLFNTIIQPNGKILMVVQTIRPALKLFESLVTYPFNIKLNQAEVEDEMHQDICGLNNQICFPTHFRSLLCDVGIFMNIVSYYCKINQEATQIQPVRQDLYALIRIIGRFISTSASVFHTQQQIKLFRSVSCECITKLLNQNKFFDTYLLLCMTKINLKFMQIQNQSNLFQRKVYFEALSRFICNGILKCKGKIEDGDKHPYRQLFQILITFINITANTHIQQLSQTCTQTALSILLTNRMVEDQQNTRLIKQFGYNNSQQIQYFKQIFQSAAIVFKLNLASNLAIINNINVSQLNKQSLTFWLHFTSYVLPNQQTTIQQTILTLKFLDIAICTQSIASLHYLYTLISQILIYISQGISTTYLWKFIQQQKKLTFTQFLSQLITYSIKTLLIPNYALIQTCLQTLKILFTKLCNNKHKQNKIYYEIFQKVCLQIDKTMLTNTQYIKLRSNLFNIISIIWINQDNINFIYRIIGNIRNKLFYQSNNINFIMYMLDITGLLQPIQSSFLYQMFIQLILDDLRIILPLYLGSNQQMDSLYGQQMFIKVFVKFVYTIIDDKALRLSYQLHSSIRIQLQQLFRPYLLPILHYNYPKRTIQLWIKFIKLNPISRLLPLCPTFKKHNSIHYKHLIRQYFDNLYRVDTQQQFIILYNYVENNLDLLVQWWQQIMIRGYKPNVNLYQIVQARIFNTIRQKQMLAKLLYKIGQYQPKYWNINGEYKNKQEYLKQFLKQYQ